MSTESQINQPTTSKSIPSPIVTDVQCKKCLKSLKSNSILKHLTQSRKHNCMSYYSEEEINAFRKNSKELSEHKRNLRVQKNKPNKSESNAKRYESKKIAMNIETKVKNKEYSKKKHENDVQKYKESLEEKAR